VTALPLNHSKETLGFGIEADGNKLAYLCDTKGLPVETLRFLIQWRPDAIIIDCTFAPDSPDETSNHNSYTDVLDIREKLLQHEVAPTFWLTHIGHDMDEFLINEWSILPSNVFVAEDNKSFELNSMQSSARLAEAYS
jgi:phosphoribosyl 1,2-cyclic phosphate phosphodiesterase